MKFYIRLFSIGFYLLTSLPASAGIDSIFSKVITQRETQLTALQMNAINVMYLIRFNPDDSLITEVYLPSLVKELKRNNRLELISEKINPADSYWKTHTFKLDRIAISQDLKSVVESINRSIKDKRFKLSVPYFSQYMDPKTKISDSEILKLKNLIEIPAVAPEFIDSLALDWQN